MVRLNKFFGGVLLIAGTSIGAGMLAIPVMTSFAGFFPTLILLFFCWLFMLTTAYLLLEVNLAFPGEINMITMAGNTLGFWGKAVAWLAYLLLLYSLTAAYISASAPLFLYAIEKITRAPVPNWIGPLPLIVIFGIFVYLGTKSVDYMNRLLMIGLSAAYFLLIGFVPQSMQVDYLGHFYGRATLIGLPLVITSFGYHIIIPSLTTYMRHNVKKLRYMIFTGSLFPLVIYILWELIVIGAVPLKGENGLIETWKAGRGAIEPLVAILNNSWIIAAAQMFSFFAIVTSFLGVSLSLTDFLRDGFKLKRNYHGRFLASLMTFLPPLFFVYTYKKGFYGALQYSAIFVAILLGILPAMMAWFIPKKSFLKTFWGRIIIFLVILGSIGVIVVDILDQKGYLTPLIAPYL